MEKITKNKTTKVFVSFIKDDNGNDTNKPNGLMTYVSDESRFQVFNITNYNDIDYIYGETYLLDNGDETYTLVTPAEAITKRNEEMLKVELRGIRDQYLLPAFDLWEKAVIRGREKDDPAIMEWYVNILNLDENAIRNVRPDAIVYYLKGE